MSNQRSKETGEQTGEPAERILRPAEAAEPESLLKPKYVNSWALVVGITRYEHTTKLDYAVDDARAIAELLVTGLGFPRENVFVILDPPPDTPDPHYDLAGTDASKAAIEDWLCTRLPAKAAGPDDRVLFFYAGHGESRELPGEPKRYKGYLVPADGRPGAWHTLIETDDVIEAGDFCEAKHLFYLFDSCFSGLAVARSDVQPSPFETVMLTNRVRMGLTAGTAKQTVADRGPGGHSPFTNFVLLGLQGEAAQMAGQVITGSDLILYVRNQVAERYGDKQTPDYGKLPGHESGGDFLFLLPAMGLTPKEQYQLGCDLYALGRIQDDEGRIESSAGHFKQAMRQSRRSGEPFPEAQVQLGRSFIALGRHKQAAEVLRQVPAEDPGSAQASFYLGIALAKMGDDRAALEAFERLLDQHPDEERAAWAGAYAEWLRAKLAGERHALLIGVCQHEDLRWAELRGPATDVQLMHQVLTHNHGFLTENIVTLRDEEATCQAIRTSLDRLIDTASPADTVVVHFSGHGFGGDSAAYLVPFDLKADVEDNQWHDVRHAIEADELHRRLQAIPARHRLLVLDTDANTRFLELARQEPSYAVFVGAGPGEQVYEWAIEPDGDDRVAGQLTYGLVQALRNPDCRGSTYGQILDQLRQILMAKPQQQRPIFAGDPDHFLFGGADPYLDCFDLAERRNFVALPTPDMRRKYSTLMAEASTSLPEMHLNFGRALVEKGEVPEAVEALHWAGEQSEGQHLEIEVTLGAVQVLTGQHEEAAARLARAAQHAEADGDLDLQLGRMMLLLKEHERAVSVLEEATRRQNGEAPLEAWFYLALAQAGRNDAESASVSLQTSLEQQETKESTSAHRGYSEWLAHGSTKHALLIGIGEYEHAPAFNLLGPRSEVGRLREVLISRYGFPESNVIPVVDKEATFQSVERAFMQLSDAVLPGAVVLVFYSGHAREREVAYVRDLRPALEEVYLTYDVDDKLDKAIPGSLLDLWLRDIPTENKLAVFDAGGPELLDLARKAHDMQRAGRYALLISASPGQMVWEGTYEHDSQRFDAGLFAHHFILRLWAADPEESTLGQILDAVADDIRGKTGARAKGHYDKAFTSAKGPTPEYVGDRNWILFSPGPDSMDLVQRASYLYDRILGNTGPEAGARELLSYLDRRPAKNVIPLLSQHITAQAETDAAAYLDLGIAHAAAGELEKGIAALTRAVEHADKRVRPEARYHLGRVLLEQAQDLDAAVSELRQAVEGDQENARAHYYLGQALLTQARRDIFAAAAEAFRIYLEGGAPLGEVEEVQEFLRSRAPEHEQTPLTRKSPRSERRSPVR